MIQMTTWFILILKRIKQMGMMEDGWNEAVKEKSDFKKIDIKQKAKRASTKQIGGDHYKDLEIQPVDYITGNNLTFLEGNAIKYITRNRKKGSGSEDIKKSIHCLELILEIEYGEK